MACEGLGLLGDPRAGDALVTALEENEPFGDDISALTAEIRALSEATSPSPTATWRWSSAETAPSYEPPA